MEVLALVPSICGHSPGQRSSIELWERVLKPAGINITYAPFETPRLRKILYENGHHFSKAFEMIQAYGQRLKLLRSLDRYDAVLVYREAALLGPAFLENLIARRNKPIIYQLDDPLFVPYVSPANGYFSYLKFFGKVADICRISRVVVVNSSQIREYVSDYNKNVWQIPSVVDTDKYVFERRRPGSHPVCIGWSGSPTTLGNLSVITEALQKLAKHGHHQLHLIGGTRFDLPGVEYTAQAWREKTEVQDLRRLDIGVVPLPVNEWNKRKFYMKVAQYMALGIPPVCTPLGSNPEVIEHGVTGFLADSIDEWVTYLELLINDSPLRLEMSVNAAKVAQAKYSLSANAGKIIGAFREALNETRPIEQRPKHRGFH